MDKAPLNRAHQLERKAESLNRQKKLDECIQCHKEAVELYKNCLQLGSDKNSQECIQLQMEWNERQIRILALKKSYLERIEREKHLKETSKSHPKEAMEKLEEKIFQNFESHDSLICYLSQRGIINTKHDHSHNTISELDENDDPLILRGSKHPKDDSTIIEELKELSSQLRESVQGLLIQLDDRNKEIEQLRNQVKELETQKSHKREDTSENLRNTFGEKLMPVSSSLVSEDILEMNNLPSLDPMPDIDISKFKQFGILAVEEPDVKVNKTNKC
ncbi:hypothetical protein ABEB36_002652 [Hypothenemus hampei]|uniref:Nuclear receptor-binding factor 2 MIT domain-containing protein n=1 Tax=Hypothenemus hampei TaxID=57062 RepID=A0ABD1F6J9_HYPHA